MRLGHVHLKVRSLEAAEKFYCTLFNLKVEERVGGHYVFLHFDNAHHDLALQAVGDDAPLPKPGSVGLYHTAFEAVDAKELYRALTALEEMQYPAALVDHQISWAIYTHDPDGNGVEIYLDRRSQSEANKSWQGRSKTLTKQQIQSLL